MQIMNASSSDYQSDMLQFETGTNGWGKGHFGVQYEYYGSMAWVCAKIHLT